jgi:PTS system nitrogen regulatory IIA component
VRISDILSEDLIVPDLGALTRDEVLERIVDCIASVRKDIDRDYALRLLIERERVGSTGVGNGLAFPHARLSNLRSVVGCFARSKEGIPFRSLDQQPAHLFVGILAPEMGGMHLKALARVSRLFKDNELRNRLMGVDDRQTMWTLITAEDQRLSQNEG